MTRLWRTGNDAGGLLDLVGVGRARTYSRRIVWPGGRLPQLVGRRRTVAVRPAVRCPNRGGDARRARAGVRHRHPSRWRARQRDSAAAAGAPPIRGRGLMSGMPRSRVTLVLVILVVLVIVTWLLTR